jgi:hypothetical protein
VGLDPLDEGGLGAGPRLTRWRVRCQLRVCAEQILREALDVPRESSEAQLLLERVDGLLLPDLPELRAGGQASGSGDDVVNGLSKGGTDHVGLCLG